MAGADGIPNRPALQAGRIGAEQPAAYAEHTAVGGTAGAGASGVIVAAGRKARDQAALQRLLPDPLEPAVGGGNFDEGHHLRVKVVEIGAPPADMGNHDYVVQAAIEIDQCRDRALILPRPRIARHLPVGRAVQRAFIAEKVHVVVAARRMVARPLVAQQREETSGFVVALYYFL